MSFKVVEDSTQIQTVQRKLFKKMVEKAQKHGEITVGFQSGQVQGTAYWFPEYRFWYVSEKSPDSKIPRYWNAFGIRTNESEPEWGLSHSHSITCEVNIPLSGSSWMVAGAFVKDQNGKFYVVHTGKIGGGAKGIGKSAFEENFSGFEQWEDVESSGGRKRVVILSDLDDENLVSNISYFVKEVKRIKDLAKDKKLHRTPKYLFKNFKPEFEGERKPYTQSQTIKSRVMHGHVVNQLAELTRKNNFDNYYNRPVDLYVEGENHHTALIEVKTNTDTTSIYKAIGQLLYNSKLINTQDPLLVAVFPLPINHELEKILNKVQIQCLWYSEKNTKITFEKVDEILNKISK